VAGTAGSARSGWSPTALAVLAGPAVLAPEEGKLLLTLLCAG